MIRMGIGFDIHRFVCGRKLILAGVEIPYEKGLDGHSDADVVLHALMDSLLGAAGDTDIGSHFPNTDMKWKDASSMKMLTYINARLQMKRVKVNNVDISILAEAPKIAPHREAMIKNIHKILALPITRISIKTTTMEGLGPIGNKEGIAAFAVSCIDMPE